MSSKVFSIITVTYNAIKTVERTILSVLLQDKHLFEYIIIDGGSTDGTVGCIKKYDSQITFWSSEKDDGIYHAMNKGISHAKGKWILFLGADDRLNNNVLKQVYEHLDDSLDLLYGNVMFNNGKRFVSTFNLKTVLNNTIHHQGAFYNIRLYDNFQYDPALKAMSDYELNLFIYLSGRKRKKIQIDIAECNLNGISSSRKVSLEELNIVRSKYFSYMPSYFFSLLLKIKFFLHYGILKN